LREKEAPSLTPPSRRKPKQKGSRTTSPISPALIEKDAIQKVGSPHPVVRGFGGVAGKPEDAWAAWVDVSRWSDGDVIDAAHLNGEFKEGSTFVSKPKGYPPSTMTITLVDPPHLWVCERRLPGVRMSFEHVIEPDVAGSKLTERLLLGGPLAKLIDPIVRRRLAAVFAAMTEQIAGQAEAGSAGSRQGSGEPA
jgi:hypothetical protein